MEVDGRDTSASICYTIRTVDDDACRSRYLDESTCLGISLDPLECGADDNEVIGNIEIEGIEEPLEYNITQRHYECPATNECECSCKPLRTWTVPYYVDSGYTGNVDFYCEYYHISANTSADTVCTKEKRIWHSSIPVSAIGSSITIDCGCSVSAHSGNTIIGCQSEAGTIVKINFSVKPSEIPGSGGTVNVICTFKKITTDTDCNETVKTGTFSLIKEVPACSGLPDKGCCYQHDTEITISLSEITGVTGDFDIYYNNEKVTENITVTVKQNPLYTEECTSGCSSDTSYCVDEHSVRILYEKAYGEGGLDEESWSGNSVPYTGGRIRVKWTYSAFTLTQMCTETVNKLQYDEIMSIGGCDESTRPNSYDILFKKQYSACTCPSKEENGIVYNFISIRPEQESCDGGEDDCNSFDPLINYSTGGCSDFNPDIQYGAGGCSDFIPEIKYGCGKITPENATHDCHAGTQQFNFEVNS